MSSPQQPMPQHQVYLPQPPQKKIGGLVFAGIAIGVGAIIAILILLGVFLSGQQNNAPTQPVPSASQTQTALPSTKDSDYLTIEKVWNEQDGATRNEICAGYHINKDIIIDAFQEGSGGIIKRSTVKRFFDDKCATSS